MKRAIQKIPISAPTSGFNTSGQSVPRLSDSTPKCSETPLVPTSEIRAKLHEKPLDKAPVSRAKSHSGDSSDLDPGTSDPKSHPPVLKIALDLKIIPEPAVISTSPCYSAPTFTVVLQVHHTDPQLNPLLDPQGTKIISFP